MYPWHMGYGMVGPFAGFGPVLVVLIIWTLIWKGLALWHSARRSEWIWFVIVLVVNTIGIIEIIYLFFFAKIKPDKLFTKDGK